MTTTKKDTPLIGVVGVCKSGKSTLVAGLEPYGLRIRPIAQEHSYVKDMWRRLRDPDILIYLYASYEIIQERRELSWTEREYRIQLERLSDAREHADIQIDTDNKTIAQVLEEVVNFLREMGAIP